MPRKPFKRIDPPTNSGQARQYILAPPLVPETVNLTSVTSVLSALPKPALKAWGEKLVAEAAVDHRAAVEAMERPEAIEWLRDAPQRQMRSRGRRGTTIHELAEAVLTGRMEPGDSVMAKHVLGFAEEWIDEIVTVEQVIVNLDHGWAGTTDLIYRNRQGDIVLADWKSSKDVYPDNALQCGAYCHGTHWVMNPTSAHPSLVEPLHIDRIAVLHITEEGITYYEPDTDIDWLYEQFLAVQTVWQALRGPDKIRLSIMLAPPRPTIEEYVAHLLARCLHAQSRNEDFRAMLNTVWPAGVPKLSSGNVVNLRQCNAIDDAIDNVEKLLSINAEIPPWFKPHESTHTECSAAS